MRISHLKCAGLAMIALPAVFSSHLTAASQERCDSYESVSAYLETAHKMHEIARAMQVFPDRSPDGNLRFWLNKDTGVWGVVRLYPPNCARVVVTGYGWEDNDGAGT